MGLAGDVKTEDLSSAWIGSWPMSEILAERQNILQNAVIHTNIDTACATLPDTYAYKHR